MLQEPALSAEDIMQEEAVQQRLKELEATQVQPLVHPSIDEQAQTQSQQPSIDEQAQTTAQQPSIDEQAETQAQLPSIDEQTETQAEQPSVDLQPDRQATDLKSQEERVHALENLVAELRAQFEKQTQDRKHPVQEEQLPAGANNVQLPSA